MQLTPHSLRKQDDGLSSCQFLIMVVTTRHVQLDEHCNPLKEIANHCGILPRKLHEHA